VKNPLVASLVLTMVLPAAAGAQVCREGYKRCNNDCIQAAEPCKVATDSNNFFILGLLVAVGAVVGVSFWLNPTDDMQKDQKTVGQPPVDFNVHENGGTLLFRTEW